MGSRRPYDRRITRRQFAAMLAATGAGVALQSTPAFALLQGEARRSASGSKVIVLGAGAAGLAAGLQLSDAGHDVTLLEARTWPGGRIHTLREPFSDGLYAEAGAGRIPETHALTLAYVERFKLPLDVYVPRPGAEVFLWRGTRLVLPPGGEPDLSRLKVNFTSREREAGFYGLSKLYLHDVCEELRRQGEAAWPYAALARYKDVTFGEFLRRQGASSDAIAYLAGGFEEDSLLGFAHDSLSFDFPKKWKIRGGNDLLPRAMAKQLAQQIRYGAEVRGIEQDASGVRVTFTARGQQHLIAADRLVCAIPFPVLRDIEVRPAWSERKGAAIRSMDLAPVVRVFVQTRTRSWEKGGLNGFASVDQPMEMWSPTLDQPGTRGILMTYLFERLAREYDAQTPQAQVDRTIELFEQVHPGIRADVETATTWSWAKEPFSRGAYTLARPGQFGHVENAAAPEGRIHFAGEHASPWPGWIQGALQSGLRAAQEVNAAG